MADSNQKDLNQFEELLREDPTSKAFAPLAEGYRKQGQLEKALKVALEGVSKNPNFNSGKVALAKILIDLKKYEIAEKALVEITENDFGNLLAHRLLGETYIHLKEPIKALTSYKSALLANPMDEVSQKMVQRLESISATTFDNKTFKSTKIITDGPKAQRDANLDAALSFLDALIARRNYKEASDFITEKLANYPGNPELLKRSSYLKGLNTVQPKISKAEAMAKPELTQKKLDVLESILSNIEQELQNRAET